LAASSDKSALDVLFEMHQQRYLQLLESGAVREAICYAQQHISTMAELKPAAVRQLMGRALFAHIPDELSPYNQDKNCTVLPELRWNELHDMVISFFCQRHGLSPSNPFFSTIRMGDAFISDITHVNKNVPSSVSSINMDLPVSIMDELFCTNAEDDVHAEFVDRMILRRLFIRFSFVPFRENKQMKRIHRCCYHVDT
jgi:hypothetical protein